MTQGSGEGPAGAVPRAPRLRRADRISAILKRLSSDRSLGVAELAASFGVSQATLRRDLQALDEQRLLTRIHGGAMLQDTAYELPVRYRDAHYKEEKQRIAAEAVRRVPEGPVAVGLTGGTTTSEVARQLMDRTELTVITNALNIAAELVLRSRLKLVVTGGVSRPQSYELVGQWAEHTLRGLNIEIAVVGTDGISAEGGLTTHDEVEAQTNAVLISRAKKTIVVADGSKVGRVLLARIAGLDQIDELITDGSADPAALEAVRAAGPAVTVV